jgi:hypothetical protein
MLFANLLFAIALTVVWPLGMLGLLAACAWLERRTLIAEEVVPRRIRRMRRKTPEAIEAMVLQETHEVIADYWSSPGRPYLGTAPSPNGHGPPAPDTAEQPGQAPTVSEQPAGVAEPEPLTSAAEPRVVPSRAARLAGRRLIRGRHERR